MAHEHNHLHSHSDETPEENQPALDAASQSLTDALRMSFRILTVLIVVLIAFFFTKGIFTVNAGYKALIIRLGRTNEGFVRDQGLHYAFPLFIDQYVLIEVKPKTLAVNTFWPKLSEATREDIIEGRAKAGESVVVKGSDDGYLLTGDMNVLEAQWEVTYQVGRPTLDRDDAAIVHYHLNVGDPVNEAQLVRGALQGAVIRTMAELPVGEVYPPRANADRTTHIKNLMQKTLDLVNCGLYVQALNLRVIRPPASVLPKFEEVLQASQTAKTEITKANQEEIKTMIDAAGGVGADLGKALDAWWAAKEAGNTSGMATQESKMKGLFATAGGESRLVIASAETYRKVTAERARGDAAQMESLLKRSPEELQVYVDHARVQLVEEVLTDAMEKYVLQPKDEPTKGTLEILLNRRAEILRDMTKVEENR